MSGNESRGTKRRANEHLDENPRRRVRLMYSDKLTDFLQEVESISNADQLEEYSKALANESIDDLGLDLEEIGILERAMIRRMKILMRLLYRAEAMSWDVAPFNEPVDTYLHGRRLLRDYDERINRSRDSTVCALCLDLIEYRHQNSSTAEPHKRVVILQCNHYFHKRCFETLLKFFSTCPLCKTEIRSYAHNITSASEFDIVRL